MSDVVPLLKSELTLEQACAMSLEDIANLGRYRLRELVQKFSLFEDEDFTEWHQMPFDDQVVHVCRQLYILDRARFGAAIAEARALAGFDTTDLAIEVGVSKRGIEKWEKGENLPVKANYEKLVEVLPPLKEVPVVGVRDIPRPVGKIAGASSESPTKPAVQSPRQESFKYPPLPPIAVPKTPEQKPAPAPKTQAPPQVKLRVGSGFDPELLAVWTKASNELKLSAEQASALKTLIDVGSKMNMTLDGFTVVLEKWLP